MFLVQACNFKNEFNSSYYCLKLKLKCIQDNKIALFRTSKGDLEVKLFGKENPVTVSNFLENIDNNIYKNKKFYKIISYPQLKFIHGGVNPENKFYFEQNQTLNKKVANPFEIKFKKINQDTTMK